MTAEREGGQIDTLPEQMYGWDGNAPKKILVGADGSLSIIGALVPANYNYVALTYVSAGNGAGKIQTVTYKTGGSGGTTVATLTLTYDSSNRLATATRS